MIWIFDDVFQIFFLVGWLFYNVVAYGRSVQRYKRERIAAEHTRIGDVLLDMAGFAGWQVIPLVYIFSPWLDFADYPLPGWTGWVGVVLLAVALTIHWQAYTTLGRSWSPKLDVRADQQLVTTGIYGVLRHPIYTGMILWALAHPLLFHNWIAGLAMLATFIPLFLIRIPREERMMVEHFGDAYREYMTHTGGIVPRLG